MHVLLLEGGKTKTLALLINGEGEIKGYSIGGSSGWTTIGFNNAIKNIRFTIKNVLKKSGISSYSIDAAFLGLSDLDTENSRAKFREAIPLMNLREHTKVYIVPDYVVAYYAVTLGKPGVSVIAGTGAIAFGRNSLGREARAGGYGWFGNDEGSAIWIALKALEAAFKSYDGRGPKTKLEEKVMSFFGLKSMVDIIDKLYTMIKEDIGEVAKLAKIVDNVAKEDEVAKEIMSLAGKELALMVKAVYDKIRVPGENYIIGGVGSVFSSKIVHSSFTETIRKTIPKAVIVEPLIFYKPIKGLLSLAVKELNLNEDIVDKVLNDLDKLIKQEAK